MTDAELVARYVTHATSAARDGKNRECFDAYLELDKLVTNEPERAWPLICEIIRRISPKDEDLLAYVAAGPLEDLLVRHPDGFIERIEILAQNDAHFRRALSGVWGCMPADIRGRVDRLLGDEPRL